jgi:hypothetical protein
MAPSSLSSVTTGGRLLLLSFRCGAVVRRDGEETRKRKERGTDRVLSDGARLSQPLAANVAMRHRRTSLARAGIGQKGGGARKKGRKGGWTRSPVLLFLTGAGEHVWQPLPPLLLSVFAELREKGTNEMRLGLQALLTAG